MKKLLNLHCCFCFFITAICAVIFCLNVFFANFESHNNANATAWQYTNTFTSSENGQNLDSSENGQTIATSKNSKNLNSSKNSQNIDSFENGQKLTSSENGQILTSSENGREIAKTLQKVSSFSTSFYTSGVNRASNVILAAKNFDYLVVPNGERLSFNAIVGKRTAENGYQDALVIVNGEYTQGIGGGVCQVSSTLYNAWIRAGQAVVSVCAHSLPTSYCDLAQDATVSDSIDLVLANNSGGDIVINATTKDKNLTFNIYAKQQDYTVRILSRIVKTIAPPPPLIDYVTTFDPSLKLYQGDFAQFAILTHAKDGYIAQSFLQRYSSGKLIDERLMRTVSYLPVQGHILLEKIVE